MTPEEIKKFTEEMRADGITDEEMAKAFMAMCVQGKIDVDDLKTLLAAVGYDLNPDIEKIMRKDPTQLGRDDFDVKKAKAEVRKEDK